MKKGTKVRLKADPERIGFIVGKATGTSNRCPQKEYLVRVFVDTDRKPAEVVTANRTSKIEKYWRRDL